MENSFKIIGDVEISFIEFMILAFAGIYKLMMLKEMSPIFI